MTSRLKQKIGVLALDVPRLCLQLFSPTLNHNWKRYANRGEQLVMRGSGYECDWQWTSRLAICDTFPPISRWLLRAALNEWPVHLADTSPPVHSSPEVTVLVGHRGAARLPLLKETVRSFAAQDVPVQLVVIEQDVECNLKSHLPEWVTYVHDKVNPGEPYNRSRAFNLGVKSAIGKVLIFHDNDMLVPVCYASEILKQVEAGYDAVNLKRFIFYVTQSDTAAFLQHKKQVSQLTSPEVVQNLEGGGSIGISKDAFFRIGQYDDSFVGWGGEDNEFWERACTLRALSAGYLPIVHLYHEAQPEKHDPDASAKARYSELAQVPATERIVRLLHKHESQA